MKINIEYLDYLKGGFYKILCLFEEDNERLPQYISSLSYELYGLQYLIENKTENIFILLSILEHFYDDSLEPNPDISLIRKEVFRCMRIIDETFKVGDILELRN